MTISRKIYQAIWRKKHPDYYRKYMKKYRDSKSKEGKIEKAHKLLFDE